MCRSAVATCWTSIAASTRSTTRSPSGPARCSLIRGGMSGLRWTAARIAPVSRRSPTPVRAARAISTFTGLVLLGLATCTIWPPSVPLRAARFRSARASRVPAASTAIPSLPVPRRLARRPERSPPRRNAVSTSSTASPTTPAACCACSATGVSGSVRRPDGSANAVPRPSRSTAPGRPSGRRPSLICPPALSYRVAAPDREGGLSPAFHGLVVGVPALRALGHRPLGLLDRRADHGRCRARVPGAHPQQGRLGRGGEEERLALADPADVGALHDLLAAQLHRVVALPVAVAERRGGHVVLADQLGQ